MVSVADPKQAPCKTHGYRSVNITHLLSLMIIHYIARIGCEVGGLAKMKEKKFTIKLIVREEGTDTELCLRLDNVSSSVPPARWTLVLLHW